MDLFKKLTALQNELKAPKGQFNTFGKYNYRNCEDILEAVKPLLVKHGVGLTVSDEIVAIGDRFYVKATAVLQFDGEQIQVTAYARECDTKKGMDDAQLTGSCSSYARKYALNGLFLIDDTKDADSMDNANTTMAATNKPFDKPAAKPRYSEFCFNADKDEITASIATGVKTVDEVILGLERKFTVGEGAKKAIRGIK